MQCSAVRCGGAVPQVKSKKARDVKSSEDRSRSLSLSRALPRGFSLPVRAALNSVCAVFGSRKEGPLSTHSSPVRLQSPLQSPVSSPLHPSSPPLHPRPTDRQTDRTGPTATGPQPTQYTTVTSRHHVHGRRGDETDADADALAAPKEEERETREKEGKGRKGRGKKPTNETRARARARKSERARERRESVRGREKVRSEASEANDLAACRSPLAAHRRQSVSGMTGIPSIPPQHQHHCTPSEPALYCMGLQVALAHRTHIHTYVYRSHLLFLSSPAARPRPPAIHLRFRQSVVTTRAERATRL